MTIDEMIAELKAAKRVYGGKMIIKHMNYDGEYGATFTSPVLKLDRGDGFWPDAPTFPDASNEPIVALLLSEGN